jgi:uncharacterized linocin/CFP29 family protein
MANDPQVPWTDEQWARVGQVIQEEARRARVAATFLPLYGPLPPDTDFVRRNIISYPPRLHPPPNEEMAIGDRDTLQLATLQVKVTVRNAQLADPEMTSVVALFRRAANVLARLEDAVVFRGLVANAAPPPEPDFIPSGGLDGLQPIWEIHQGQEAPGLWIPPQPDGSREEQWPPNPKEWQWIPVVPLGGERADEALVGAVSKAIGDLEGNGHFGPFAVVLGQGLFLIAQSPSPSLVLPQDRIIPFLGGGSLLRSSTLDVCKGNSGIVVALGGTPVELVVAKDVSLQFLQVTQHPNFVFRVYEKIALRIKEFEAIVRLIVPPYVEITAAAKAEEAAKAAAAKAEEAAKAAKAAAAKTEEAAKVAGDKAEEAAKAAADEAKPAEVKARGRKRARAKANDAGEP